MTKAIRRILIPNRGEIAVRIIRTCRQLGIETVLAASSADRSSLAAEMADRTVVLGPPPAAQSYLDANLVVHAALATGCDAVHPGYGFLSERPVLAMLCVENGLIFIGPEAETIRRFGDKLEARHLADLAGAPTVTGSAALADVHAAVTAADDVGYPVLIKAAAGGGGRGMAVAGTADVVRSAFARLAKEAADAFGDGTLYLERFVARARHVEIQAIGDGRGLVYSLGERDCSVQRRHQKVIEEAPAPALSPGARTRMTDGAVALLSSLDYRGVGTVEFLYDVAADEASFIEVNARIQVEHPVTEQITGHDIVALQLAVAGGEDLPAGLARHASQGHAIEFRINAEDASHGFAPSPGRITGWEPPAGCGIRFDTFCRPGDIVSPYYDSLLGKLIIHGSDRDEALARARDAVGGFVAEGIATNLPLLREVCADPDFCANDFDTRWLEREFLPRFNP